MIRFLEDQRRFSTESKKYHESETAFIPRSKNMRRFRQEYTGTWKQYSGRKIFGFFPVHSDHFPALSRQKLVRNHRKKSGIFRPEYCFHVPMTYGVFLQDPAFFPSLSCRFLRDLVTGIFDLG